MSRTVRTLLIFVGIVLAVLIGLHIFAAPLMASLRVWVHGR